MSLHTFTLLMTIRNTLMTMRLLYFLKIFPFFPNTSIFEDDTEIENACKPGCYLELAKNLKDDLSRIKSYFDTNKCNMYPGKLAI